MTSPKVFIVEDEVLAAMVLEDLLVDLGCEVIASFGELRPALDWLAAQPEPPHGAVLDVNLGGEMVFPLAEVLASRAIPFAFATGYASVADQRFADAPLISKPVDVGRLSQVVSGFRTAAGAVRATNSSAGL